MGPASMAAVHLPSATAAPATASILKHKTSAGSVAATSRSLRRLETPWGALTLGTGASRMIAELHPACVLRLVWLRSACAEVNTSHGVDDSLI